MPIMSTGLPILMTPETGSREFHVKWGEAGLNSLASQRRVATRRLNCAILLFFMAWVVKFPIDGYKIRYRKVASSRPVYYSKVTGHRPKVTVHKDQISPS